MNGEAIGASVVHFPLKKEGRERAEERWKKNRPSYGENLLCSGVDFPLSNTCQFFSLNRGEEDGKIIAANKRTRGGGGGGEGGWEDGRRGGGWGGGGVLI